MTYNNDQLKAAFMDLLSDYTQNGVDHVYVDSFCQICPLQKHQWGGCSKDLNLDYDYNTCDEEIFKWYVEKSK